MRFEQKFEPVLRIETCTGGLNLKHCAECRWIDSNFVRSSHQACTCQPATSSDKIHDMFLFSLRRMT